MTKLIGAGDFELLTRLNGWYRLNCDADWEHGWGIRITTLDNPGWMIEVELAGTAFESKVVEERSEGVLDNNTTTDGFLAVRKVGTKFQAAGTNLIQVLTEFVDWSQNP